MIDGGGRLICNNGAAAALLVRSAVALRGATIRIEAGRRA